MKNRLALVAVALGVLVSGIASAAAPDVSAFTSIGADMTATATTLFATFAGVAAGIWVLYYVFSMGKKMAGKAT